MTWAAKIISFCVFSPWCRSRAVVSGTARAGTHRPCWEMKEPTSKWAVGSWERGLEQPLGTMLVASHWNSFLSISGRDKKNNQYDETCCSTDKHWILSLQINGKSILWCYKRFQCSFKKIWDQISVPFTDVAVKQSKSTDCRQTFSV